MNILCRLRFFLSGSGSLLCAVFVCVIMAITPVSAGYLDSQETGNHNATEGQLLWQFETGG